MDFQVCSPFRNAPSARFSGSTVSVNSSKASNSSTQEKVAVIYQAIEPPIINGVRKPMKPGGYRDSGADIAYNLRTINSVEAVFPVSVPSPEKDSEWCFPDTEEGMLDAVKRGATHLWANTILFASHPLQTSTALGKLEDTLKVVGHGPLVVEKYDDKELVNKLLRRTGGFTMPRSWTIHHTPEFSATLRQKTCHSPSLPSRSEDEEAMAHHVGRIPCRRRGHGHCDAPNGEKNKYWSLPIVTRFNHQDGIAPYNGVVAVTANSRVVTKEEEKDPAYEQISRECEKVAEVLAVTAPIRIDVRRFDDSPGSKFALFDVNMKPNMTGPGRPGRDDQASLTLMAAEALGWDYPELLRQILYTSSTLRALRELKPNE
ncbi:D-alanine--D-alanine ligase [Colletotrichum tofieldiae]|nr:D-alanine--D-alanine ligase [Colletotrichum tofieldiae]